MKGLAMYVSVTLLMSFLTLVVGVCFVIWKVQERDTIRSELSLTHQCRTKLLRGGTDSTSEPLLNESNDCSLTIKASPSSGLSSSKRTGDHISTSSPIDSSSTDGSVPHGIKSLTRDVLRTPKLDAVLKPLEQESAVFLPTHQSTVLNESKKPCQTCIKIRKVLGVGGA